jgi:hypothetical protein
VCGSAAVCGGAAACGSEQKKSNWSKLFLCCTGISMFIVVIIIIITGIN